MKIIEDSKLKPDLFVWNGAISDQILQEWLTKSALNIPPDLLELWLTTGGGDFFESEIIYSPVGDAILGENIDTVNSFHYSKGMSRDILIFYEGLGLAAVDLISSKYIQLDTQYNQLAAYDSLDDWYIHTVRADYQEKYRL